MEAIVNLLYTRVKNGKMALEKVPTPYREEVTKLLEESDE